MINNDNQLLIDKTFEKHKKIIIDSCLSLQPNLQAIILYGGYGRDEGSWFQDDNGDWCPYNDYDLCIVSKLTTPLDVLESLKKSLAKELGIKWIDLSQFHPEQMKELRITILNYDFKNGSKVIFGDTTVLDLIPFIESTQITMGEAKVLFFTRLYTLIGSLGGKGLNEVLSGESSRFFRNQMAKAVLAVVDVLLLAKNSYDASYCKRLERVAEMYPEKQELLKLSRWALAEKLQPQAPLMSPDEVRNLYGLVHKHFFAEMYRGLSLHFCKAVNGPEDIEYCMKWSPITMLKRLWCFVRFLDFRVERKIDIMLAQSYIAAAWGPSNISEKLLSRGIAMLRRVDDRVPQDITWDDARMEAARLRMVKQP